MQIISQPIPNQITQYIDLPGIRMSKWISFGWCGATAAALWWVPASPIWMDAKARKKAERMQIYNSSRCNAFFGRQEQINFFFHSPLFLLFIFGLISCSVRSALLLLFSVHCLNSACEITGLWFHVSYIINPSYTVFWHFEKVAMWRKVKMQSGCWILILMLML